MTDYTELRINISPCSEAATDLMAAFLADIGFDSFLPDEEGLTAYVPVKDFKPDEVATLMSEFPMDVSLSWQTETIEGKDWNEEWEKNYFQPILIADKCAIHSTFHQDVPKAEYDIVIDPKMAFGTGHHATTSLMLTYLLCLPLQGAGVIDMGTGTGILSILCAMRGAQSVYAIEIDPDAAENAREHTTLNHVADKVTVITGDASALATLPEADLFLANINRNIILADLNEYASKIKSGGTLLLSGFYLEDVPLIEKGAEANGLKLIETKSSGDWCALRLKKY